MSAAAVSNGLPFRRWLTLSVAGFVAFFAIWWLIAASGLVHRQFLPTPPEVIEKFVALTQSPFVGYTLQQHLASSFGRFASGFGLAVLIGVPLGLLMGWFRWLDATISSAPTSDCQPRPALIRRPATIDGIDAGSSTSVIMRKWLAPSVCAASMKRGSTNFAPR